MVTLGGGINCMSGDAKIVNKALSIHYYILHYTSHNIKPINRKNMLKTRRKKAETSYNERIIIVSPLLSESKIKYFVEKVVNLELNT